MTVNNLEKEIMELPNLNYTKARTYIKTSHKLFHVIINSTYNPSLLMVVNIVNL